MSMIGKTLAHYEITGQLGKGGMGEVYQAKDRKLGRDVAIKVLPDEFAKDADRVARFQREAKLLASLNHPNIAAIHGLEESGGIQFLVLELVEGETLSDQLKRGPIAVEESLKLALQIAEALDAPQGKAAYMSAGQARGETVDKRTGIWAFGCVLFEMLTGRAAFSGKDVTDILAAVIRGEPEWSSLPASLHWRLGGGVERCLRKELKERYTDISD